MRTRGFGGVFFEVRLLHHFVVFLWTFGTSNIELSLERELDFHFFNLAPKSFHSGSIWETLWRRLGTLF